MLQRIPLPYELSGDFVSVKLDHMLMPFKLLRALKMAHFHYKSAHALSICLEAHESLSACTLSTPKRSENKRSFLWKSHTFKTLFKRFYGDRMNSRKIRELINTLNFFLFFIFNVVSQDSWMAEWGDGKGKVTFLLLLLLGLSVCPSEYFWVSSIGFGCWLTMPSHIDKGKRKDLFFTSGVQIFAFQVPWLKGWEVSCRLQDHYRPEVNKVYSERASGVVKFRTGS